MVTQAFKAYGTQIRLGDGVPLAALTITTATNTTPIVVTTGTAHGVVDVSYATVVGVTGNLGANGSWVVQRTGTNTLILRNSAGTGAYVSGGTLTLSSTFASVAELRNVTGAGSRADLIDVSSHDGNGYSSEIASLKRTNQMQLDINLVPGNPTHNQTTGLLALYNSKAYRHWLLVLPAATVGANKAAGHVYGFVDYYTINLPVTAALQAQMTLAFDGAFDFTS
jgi:hypothetical protein